MGSRGPTPEDLAGRRFGRLRALSFVEIRGRTRYWRCACRCGSEKIISSTALRSGDTRSCGCLLRESARARGLARRTHGYSGTSTYRIWQLMWSRCTNRKLVDWPNYGGRGIRVCARWKKFSNFLHDMGERPSGLTIERKNTNGHYSPSNCVWATKSAQASNKRNNVFVSFRGERLHLEAWARRVGVRSETLRYRLKNWSLEKAMTTPPRRW